MKNIGMPAFWLTPDCIWNSFLSSGKKHLILTGSKHSGKTTLISSFPGYPFPGITTWVIPQKAVYLKENATENIIRVGTFDDTLSGTDRKMILCDDGFISLGIPALQRCIASDSEWVSVDEIGYLELRYAAYCMAIKKVMEKKRLIAVVRKQEHPFLQELCGHEDVFLVDLDQPFGINGCVIMASGLGKRFGGNKLMADFGGKPLICRTLEVTEGIFTKRVVVTRHKEVAELCENQGVQVIFHQLPYRSDTVRLGLEAMDGMENCMFCLGDQPLLRRESIAALALAAVNDKESIWRTSYGQNYGSPVLFPKWTFEELLHLPEGKGGGFVIKKYPERLRTINVRDMYELLDVDTPEDLISLAER